MTLTGVYCSLTHVPQDESAQLARSCIERVLNHAGHDLNDLTSWLNRELRSPLTTLGHAPTVSASLGTRLEVHSLCHRIQLAELGGDRLVQDVIVTWKELVLWSTLQPADTARLSSLLGSSILKPASATPSFWASTSSAQSNLQRLDNGFLVLRPADLGANSPEPEAPGVHSLPFVYSTSSRLKYLLVHHTGHLGIISLMMRGQEELSDAALTALLRVMKPPAAALAARLTEEAQAQGGELGHVAGWRYAVREDDHIIRASPRSKVSAMTHHARAVGSALVDSLSRTYPGAAVGNVSLSIANGEKSSVENGETAASNGSEDTVDVSVKSSYGTWAKAQGGRAAGKLSVAIREKKMEDGIAKDLDAIDAGLRSLELV